MKQRKLSGSRTNYSSCSDECNGHVNYNFKRANSIDDEYRSTNGNHIRPQKVQIKSDKPKNFVACVAYDAQMNNRYNNNRSHQQQQWWCQRFIHDVNSKIVQNCCSLRIRPNYNSSSKFAFHDSILLRPIVIVFVLLLFSVQYCVANGQHIESQWNAKNTGEWVIFLCAHNITTKRMKRTLLGACDSIWLLRPCARSPPPPPSLHSHLAVWVCRVIGRIDNFKWLNTEFVEVFCI